MATKNIFGFIKQLISIALLLTTGTSCKKFVETGYPTTSIHQENVYNNNATAAAVLTGIYTDISDQRLSASISFSTGLTSDELTLLDLNERQFFMLYTNKFSETQDMRNFAADYWYKLYPIIYATNAAFEGISASTELNPALKQQLLGEARFMRAYCYFYLVNFYGDVPLALTTNYKINAILPRTPAVTVYQQIIRDLNEAWNLLPDKYVAPDATVSAERVRPNKWTATALLARAYLYAGDYKNAELHATKVINNSGLFDLQPLNKVFQKESKEIIWALQVVDANNSRNANTEEGRKYILTAQANEGTTAFLFALSNSFVQRFEVNDQRAINWIGTYSNSMHTYYFPYKYKVGVGVSGSTEYSVLFRLAELYLVRAEAYIQQGGNNVANGIADLNKLRTRATDFTVAPENRLPQLPLDADKAQALRMLEYERMAELFTEGGHRWFDLKRTPDFTNPLKSRADVVIGAIKGNDWKSTAQLFPIPLDEIMRNRSLVGHQNPGYGN